MFARSISFKLIWGGYLAPITSSLKAACGSSKEGDVTETVTPVQVVQTQRRSKEYVSPPWWSSRVTYRGVRDLPFQVQCCLRHVSLCLILFWYDLPFCLLFRLKALAERKRQRKKEREAAARLRSRVAMGMENHAVDLPEEEGVFALASIKVRVIAVTGIEECLFSFTRHRVFASSPQHCVNMGVRLS